MSAMFMPYGPLTSIMVHSKLLDELQLAGWSLCNMCREWVGETILLVFLLMMCSIQNTNQPCRLYSLTFENGF